MKAIQVRFFLLTKIEDLVQTSDDFRRSKNKYMRNVFCYYKLSFSLHDAMVKSFICSIEKMNRLGFSKL
ncbi:hypothetical protein DN068_07100 [Taibaiella soli]|uniref:Uncharacterized protein n=2 Tax=Taibaiella soli TaxID=1649169 RepID=A0A2W2BD17_9BACT|nr:hypothetical protein DN068_07100 [Taibaiella soli]